MIGRTIAELASGDFAEIVKRVEMDDIDEFVDAVGDHNPIHRDPAFAAATAFGEPIAPGVFTAGLISAVIGTKLPGPGAIYLAQNLNFVRPVKVGDTITARVEVREVLGERNRVRLSTVCRNQRGEEVLAGEAWVMPPRTTIRYERAPTSARPTVPPLLQPWMWAAEAWAWWSRLGVSILAAGLTRPRA